MGAAAGGLADRLNRVAVAVAAEEDPGAVGLRRPDYSFRGRADPPPSRGRAAIGRNRHDSPRPIYQVKAYGWNADVPVALLADFEELVAFDCRYQPVFAEPKTRSSPSLTASSRAARAPRHSTLLDTWTADPRSSRVSPIAMTTFGWGFAVPDPGCQVGSV